jgi:hypothetical protein
MTKLPEVQGSSVQTRVLNEVKDLSEAEYPSKLRTREARTLNLNF